MATAQLICFFLTGFLVSRLFIKTKLPQRIVYELIGKDQLSLTRVLLYLIATAALLSFFIPNAIAVLTLLPVLELLRQGYSEAKQSANNIPTLLALTVIFGANIGGMGSITATPANGILVSYAELNSAPGAEYLTFAAWLLWGIPLVILLVFISWIVLITLSRPWRYKLGKIRLPFDKAATEHPFQQVAIGITIVFFASSLLFSGLLMQFPEWGLTIVILTVIFTLLLSGALFLLPFSYDNKTKMPVLTIPDCYNELPMKGFLFVGIAVVIAGVLYLLKINEVFSEWINLLLPKDISILVFFLLLALVTSFSTEVLSNTAVQISMFLIVLPLSETMGFPAVLALIIVTLSCTCAFMSPIATGVNGLAYGGVKDVSLVRMLLAGSVMNTAAAIVITIWAIQVIASIFGLS